MVRKTADKVKTQWKNLVKKWWEIWAWKLKYATQKWFFSLDEDQQSFIETTYMVVLQLCPDLWWEDYLDRMRKAHACNVWFEKIVENASIPSFKH